MANPDLLRQQCPSGSVPYVVRAGDTLTNIASFYNTTVEDILNANPGVEANALKIGADMCASSGSNLPGLSHYQLLCRR